MATGDVSFASNVKRTIELATITANVAAPTLPTDGVECYAREGIFGSDSGAFYVGEPPPEKSMLSVRASGTTPSTILTLWGYIAAQAAWFPHLSVRNGVAITANYEELVEGLGHYDRLAVQSASTSGTTPSFDIRLTTTVRVGK